MVQTIKENFRIMNKFVKNLKENGIEKILFFGSRLRGDFYPESDFDILVVSNKFQKMSKGKRNLFMYQFWKEDIPVDFLCYTLEEFERNVNRATIVNEAVKKGIEMI